MTNPALQRPDLWRFQSAQVAEIERIFSFLASAFPSRVSNAGGFVYDGLNRLEQFTADGVLYSLAYPDAFTINIAYSGILRQVTLNGSGQVIGIATL